MHTMAKFEKTPSGIKVTANPVTLRLAQKDIEIQSIFEIEEGSGEMKVTRNVLSDLGGEEITIEEYMTGAFGLNEYQDDMTSLTLGVDDESIQYGYLGRRIERPGEKAYVNIPPISTRVELRGEGTRLSVEEGIAFSPVYKLFASKTMKKGGLTTWLRLARVN